MRAHYSTIRALAIALPLAVTIGLPSAAHAEHWFGTDVCLDLDSVHIITNSNGSRYVTYRQQLCDGSGILLWAVADSDCEKVRGKDAATVDLYVYKEDDGKWVTMFDYFIFPTDLDVQYANAGMACNWAHPKFP